MRKLEGDNDECCGYRERLTKEKRRPNRVSQSPKKNVTDRCGKKDASESDCTQSKTSICCPSEKKSKNFKEIKKSAKTSLNMDQTLCRIKKMKPSLEERDKYVNVTHILCVLDTEEAVKLKNVREMRKIQEKNEEFEENKCIENMGSIQEERQSMKTEEGFNRNITEEKKGEKLKKKGLHDENKMVNGADEQCGNESNSICSIDSDIDIEGFALTKEDINNIEKNRRQPDLQEKNREGNISEDDAAKS